MLGTPKAPYQPTWKHIEDDFVIGACTRRFLGYMSSTAGGILAAFDNDAEPVGILNNERDAREALCASNEPAHAKHCVGGACERVPWPAAVPRGPLFRPSAAQVTCSHDECPG